MVAWAALAVAIVLGPCLLLAPVFSAPPGEGAVMLACITVAVFVLAALFGIISLPSHGDLHIYHPSGIAGSPRPTTATDEVKAAALIALCISNLLCDAGGLVACPLHPWQCWLILLNNPFAPALLAFVAAAFLTLQQLILDAIRVADQARQQADHAATTDEERAWHGLAVQSSPPSTTTLDAATPAAALLSAVAAALRCNGIRLDVSLST